MESSEREDFRPFTLNWTMGCSTGGVKGPGLGEMSPEVRRRRRMRRRRRVEENAESRTPR